MSNLMLDEYRRCIAEAVTKDYDDNFDIERFGSLSVDSRQMPARPWGLELMSISGMRRVLSAAKWKTINVLKASSRRRALSERAELLIRPVIEESQWLYEKLVDDQSRELLVKLLAYRALGHRHVKLPLSSPAYWETCKQLKALRDESDAIDTGFLGWAVYRTDLTPIGLPLQMYLRSVHETFVLEQYRARLAKGSIEARPGDVVIDAGGCWGDTAFYFAHKVRQSGHVYSFEFLPANLRIFEKNIQINPDLASQITVVKNPLWSSSDQELFIEGDGPATRVLDSSNDPNATKINTLSIDHFVERESLQKLDFIKMDIEGAELAALKGSEQAIKKFRPKLAISVYHRPSDLWEIPTFIDNLSLGYRFFLRHFTIHQEETVLFAEAPR